MPISRKTLSAAVSLPLLLLLYSGLNTRSSQAQRPPADICTRNLLPIESVSSNSKTHVIADGYQFDYPANYRLVLENDGSLFVTDERNYQYLQCLLEYRPPTEFLPNGITISWRRLEQLYGGDDFRISMNVISTETISGKTLHFLLFVEHIMTQFKLEFLQEEVMW